MAGTIGGQGLAFFLVRRRRGSIGLCALAAVGALPITLLASGAAAWLPTDYPHFVLENARERLGVPKGPIRCVVPGPAAGASCCLGGRADGPRPSAEP